MTGEDQANDSQRKDVLTWAYAQFVSDVSGILYRFDPLGIGHPMPGSEYEPEAQRLVPRLSKCSDRDDVMSVLTSAFEASDEVDFGQLADDLWWACDLFMTRSKEA